MRSSQTSLILFSFEYNMIDNPLTKEYNLDIFHVDWYYISIWRILLWFYNTKALIIMIEAFTNI